MKANRGPGVGPENRRAIMAAARELFAESGFGVPFSAIAKRAGVGQATLYRNFSDKVALAVAISEENLAALAEGKPNLHEILLRAAAQAAVSSAFQQALAAEWENPATQRLGQKMRLVVAGVLERERSAGTIRDDATIDDVATGISMVAFHAGLTPFDQPATSARAIAIVERGLRP